MTLVEALRRACRKNNTWAATRPAWARVYGAPIPWEEETRLIETLQIRVHNIQLRDRQIAAYRVVGE